MFEKEIAEAGTVLVVGDELIVPDTAKDLYNIHTLDRVTPHVLRERGMPPQYDLVVLHKVFESRGDASDPDSFDSVLGRLLSCVRSTLITCQPLELCFAYLKADHLRKWDACIMPPDEDDAENKHILLIRRRAAVVSEKPKRSQIVIRDPDHPWNAPFYQDECWNNWISRKLHQIWWDTLTLPMIHDPDSEDHIPRQLEVYVDGKLTICAPMYYNEVGEWSMFDFNGATEAPPWTIRYLEWFAPNLHEFREAVVLAGEEHGVRFDIPQLRSRFISDEVLAVFAERWPEFHEGVPVPAVNACPLDVYIDSRDTKLRKNMRGLLKKFEGWTYKPTDLADPDWEPIYRDWLTHYTIPMYSADFTKALFDLLKSNHTMHLFRIERNGELVGFDCVTEAAGVIESDMTPYKRTMRTENVGYFALFGLISHFSALPEYAGRALSLGARSYLEGDTLAVFDPSMEYKTKWATQQIRTWVFGEGMWEYRKTPPQVPLRGDTHFQILFYAMLAITAGIRQKVTRAVPEGWAEPLEQVHFFDVLRAAASGEHKPWDIPARMYNAFKPASDKMLSDPTLVPVETLQATLAELHAIETE